MLSAAASARLCVETFPKRFDLLLMRAAASARLCVETALAKTEQNNTSRSRLRAAVC